MPFIEDSDMDDFDSALLTAGFRVNDFSIVDLVDDLQGNEQQPTTGTVTVHRLSTDEARTYRVGQLSKWVAEFTLDLHEGKFDM